MLRLKCLIGLSTPQLRNAVVGQIKYQRDTLLSLRLRRHDIIAALDHAIDAAGRHGDDFSVVSHSHIKEAFDNFVADGTKWNDVGALAKEKFSVSPSVSIEGDFVLTHTVPSLIEYIVVEMLKNSMKSVVDRYGALNLEDIDDAISLELSSSSSGSPTAHYSLSIRDKGMGMSPQVLSRCGDAFFTTAVKSESPNYHYSRDFGVPFNGAGFGFAKSKVSTAAFSTVHPGDKVYLDFLGGSLDIASTEGEGTDIRIRFEED